MAQNRKGSPHQAKHYQPEDHAHAAHQEQAPHGHEPMPDQGPAKERKDQARKPGHPMERTPKGPRKGQ